MVIVSGCLLGIHCKYNGGNNLSEKVLARYRTQGILPLCPEQLGGLTTPRVPAEIVGGAGQQVLEGQARVMTADETDVTEAFIRGAEETLATAKIFQVEKAILKACSPSCGAGTIYDGSFSGKMISGDGVTTALLKAHGIEVITEKDL